MEGLSRGGWSSGEIQLLSEKEHKAEKRTISVSTSSLWDPANSSKPEPSDQG